MHYTVTQHHIMVWSFMWERHQHLSVKKQKFMSNNPTETEPIVLMDNLGLIELFKEFLEFLMMSSMLTPVIHQDCTVVITLVTKGGGITKTKHQRARMNKGREMVEEK
jgi:hypothetical protein